MPPRTSSPQVIEVLGNDYTPGKNLNSYIQTANIVVNRIRTCATAKNIPLSDEELEMLERWLAAHYYAVMAGQYAWRKSEGTSSSSQGKSNMYLESTFYGQTAVRIDPSGCLEAIAGAMKKKVSLLWLGKAPSEQIDYDDRD